MPISRTRSGSLGRSEEVFVLQLLNRLVERSSDHSLRIEIIMRCNHVVVRSVYRRVLMMNDLFPL